MFGKMEQRAELRNEMASGPLAGVRVVDLTQMLAGPYATMLLADLGADVIKVEPLVGEFIRFAGPNLPGQSSDGGYFQSVNRNKRGVCLNLKCESGREVLRRLVRDSDVVVENFRVGVLDRLGIGYDDLKTVNPAIVYACIRGFGDPRTGVSPYVDWPAYDVIAQAMGGIMEVTGEPEGPPIKTGPGLGDIFPASLLATGILAALIKAHRTGEGSFVDVAMYDAVLSMCERLVYQHSVSGDAPHRQGNDHPFFEPFSIYPARDGWVAIAAPDDQYWRPLATVMDRADLLTHPDFASPEARGQNRVKVRDIVTSWTEQRTVAEIKALLGGVVPFGPVQDVAQIVADPHVRVRDMVWSLQPAGVGRPIQVAGNPIKIAGHSATAAVPAPTLGQDTDTVLSELGYSSTDISTLRTEGAVA